MIIEIPDHYKNNVAGAMVHRAVAVINESGIVPAYIHQYADLWEKGLNYGVRNQTFWNAVHNYGANERTLVLNGLI